MGRFIFLTFGFLAVAFYELSGGAEFDPAAAGELIVTARSDREISQTTLPSVVADATPETDQQSQDEVSRAALNLVAFEAVETESVTANTPVEETVVPVAIVSEAVEPEKIEPRVEVLGIASLGETELPGVSFEGLTASASSNAVEPQLDIRTVSGSLVNMRSGPGTEYDVVDQLPRNTRVEIISDAGNGWVELRPIDGGASGWMADFLLSGG